MGAANTEWGEITELQKATELDTICCNDTICSNCNENVDEKIERENDDSTHWRVSTGEAPGSNIAYFLYYFTKLIYSYMIYVL